VYSIVLGCSDGVARCIVAQKPFVFCCRCCGQVPSPQERRSCRRYHDVRRGHRAIVLPMLSLPLSAVAAPLTALTHADAVVSLTAPLCVCSRSSAVAGDQLHHLALDDSTDRDHCRHRCRTVCRGMARDVTVMPSHRSRCQCHCSRAMYVVLLSMYADVSGSGLDTVLP
jgi:hypothetical protein